jgi:hypothetical protein
MRESRVLGLQVVEGCRKLHKMLGLSARTRAAHIGAQWTSLPIDAKLERPRVINNWRSLLK